MDLEKVEIDEVRKLAEADDLSAQIFLGWAYGPGGSEERNDVEAEKWLRKAYAADSLEGLRRLCRLKLEQNQTEFLLLASELIERGDFYGHYMLGNAQLRGLCEVPVSKVEGLRNLELASRKGHLISRIDYLRNTPDFSRFSLVRMWKIITLVPRIFSLLLRDRQNPAVYM